MKEKGRDMTERLPLPARHRTASATSCACSTPGSPRRRHAPGRMRPRMMLALVFVVSLLYTTLPVECMYGAPGIGRWKEFSGHLL